MSVPGLLDPNDRVPEADVGADLVVIGVHGRNALDLGVFGSTANRWCVRRRVPC
jgi:hypothetical protein